MVLDVGQICDLKPTIGTIPRSYQNHIKIVAKPHQKRIKTISKSYQNHKNHRKILQKPVSGMFLVPFFEANPSEPYPKSYQNYKNPRKIVQKTSKNCSWAVSVSFFEANSLEPTRKCLYTQKPLHTNAAHKRLHTDVFTHLL